MSLELLDDDFDLDLELEPDEYKELKSDDPDSLEDDLVDSNDDKSDSLKFKLRTFNKRILPELNKYLVFRYWEFEDLNIRIKASIYNIELKNFFSFLSDELLIRFSPLKLTLQEKYWLEEINNRNLVDTINERNHKILAETTEKMIKTSVGQGVWSFEMFDTNKTIRKQITDYKILAKFLSIENLRNYRGYYTISDAFNNELTERGVLSAQEIKNAEKLEQASKSIVAHFTDQSEWTLIELKELDDNAYYLINRYGGLEGLIKYLPTDLLKTNRQSKKTEQVIVLRELMSRLYPETTFSSEEIESLLNLRTAVEYTIEIENELIESEYIWAVTTIRSKHRDEIACNPHNLYRFMNLETLKRTKEHSRLTGKGKVINDEINLRQQNPDYEVDLKQIIQFIFTDPTKLLLKLMRLRVDSKYFDKITKFIPKQILATLDNPDLNKLTQHEKLEYAVLYLELYSREIGIWEIEFLPSEILDCIIDLGLIESVYFRLSKFALAREHKSVIERPKIRCDCQNGPRPCPWVSCKFHLSLSNAEFRKTFDSLSDGIISINELVDRVVNGESNCALDYADQGENLLDDIGEYLGVSRERIRQVIAKIMKKSIRKKDKEELAKHL